MATYKITTTHGESGTVWSVVRENNPDNPADWEVIYSSRNRMQANAFMGRKLKERDGHYSGVLHA